MDLTKALLQVIDTRSFSSLWYWLMLALAWSMASHWVLGVPFDMIVRARRQGGEAMQDLRDLVRVQVLRTTAISRRMGPWLVGAAGFAVSALLVLGFWHWIEIAQALAFLLLPLIGVAAMGVALARRMEAEDPDNELMVQRLLRHRFWTQAIGMVTIFVTALFGMYQNLLLIGL